MKQRIAKRITSLSFLVIALLAGAVLSVEGYYVSQTRSLAKQTRGLVGENQQRIAEQQESRLRSCRQTYESFNEVFKPFFPPPKQRTSAQRKSLQKLENRVRELKRTCPKQTATR
jgi:uncharacterized protein HemX